MTFPTGVVISEANLDSATDDPSLARSDLLLAVQSLNTIIDGAGLADGVAVLDSSGYLPSSQVPNTISPPTGILTLSPVSKFVKIQDVLRLQILDTDTVDNLADVAEGDLVYVNDGDSGSPCLAVYDGTDWLRISLGVAISAT
jgi:hypothetical protein